MKQQQPARPSPQPARSSEAAQAEQATQAARPPRRWQVTAALRLRRLLRAASDAVVPAPLALFEQIGSFMQTHLLRAAARLRLADLLADGPLTVEQLAAQAGVGADSLTRLLRGLATVGVFTRLPDGRFRNSRASLALRGDAPISMRDCALYFGSAAQQAAWGDLEQSLAGTPAGGAGAVGAGRGSAFERVHGMTTWEWFERHADEGAAFAGTMVAMTRLFAPGLAHAYADWGAVRRLCDVGGGHGDLLAEVLLRHPHLRAVLFDSPGMLATARPFLAARGVLPRVELAPGNFFADVPAGCDAYLLKNILHDWDDERAVQILGNCRRAMQPGHRLLVVEALVEADTTREMGPLSDLQMMVICSGGRERGHAELARLFQRAGFELRRALPTPGPMSLCEGFAV